MRVLVTGAAGFIGSHVAEALQAAGHEVRGLDSLAPAVHACRPDYVNWELITGDIRDPETVTEALADVDAVCHQAAIVGLGLDTASHRLVQGERVEREAEYVAALGTGHDSHAISSQPSSYGRHSWSTTPGGYSRSRAPRRS